MQLGEQILVLVLQFRGTIYEYTEDFDLQRAIQAANATTRATQAQICRNALAASVM